MYLLVDCRFYYGRTQVPIHARSHTNGHVVNSRTNTWPTNSMAWMAANGTRMHIRNLMVSGGHWAHIYIYITIRYTYIIHIQCLLSAWVKSLSAWIRGRTFCMHVLTLNSMPSYIIRLIICCCCSIFCFFFSPDISKIQTFVGKLKSTRESSKVYSMLTDLYSACMNLESLDKSQSDSELRKAIIYLCEYSNSCYFLFFFVKFRGMFSIFAPKTIWYSICLSFCIAINQCLLAVGSKVRKSSAPVFGCIYSIESM